MYKYLCSGELRKDDKKARKILLESTDFVLEDELLYHLWSPRTIYLDRACAIVKQLCIPEPCRLAIAYSFHDMLQHAGIDRVDWVVGSIRLKYHLPNAYTFLKAVIMRSLQTNQDFVKFGIPTCMGPLALRQKQDINMLS
jgi:hypothetical protein